MVGHLSVFEGMFRWVRRGVLLEPSELWRIKHKGANDSRMTVSPQMNVDM
jgi:hypothetical protein